MSDLLEAAPTTPAALRRKTPYAYGAASLALGSVVWLSYGALIVTIALLVAFVPGWLVLLIQLTDATGLPFVILTGGPWGFVFGVMALFGVVGSVAFVVFICASALSLLGVVYGVVGLVHRERRPFAVAGILLSAIIVIVNVVLVILVVASYSTPVG